MKTLLEMTTDLVRTPSRAGLDDYRPIIHKAVSWLEQLGVAHQVIEVAGNEVAVVAEVGSGDAGPTYVLNATLDTAGFGDESQWNRPPTSGVIAAGWLHGRGSADSKSGVAVFSHVAAALMSVDDPQGRIYLLLDVDEHTGGFAGARAFFDETRRRGDSIEGVMIGYPGNDRVVIGGRGFTRYEVTVRGMSGHSGSRSRTAVNAVSKAAALVSQIDAATPSLPFDADFGMKPEATVTRVVGGESYSVVPDICAMYVDIRTTGAFGREAASEWLQQIITRVDDEWPSPPTQVTITGSQDAFRVPAQATFVEALATSASAVFDRPIPAEVVGPSNVGNYFASFGVPATAGFGVTYRGLHAVNECIEVATLQPSYETYLGAIAALMGTSSKAASA